MSNQCWILVGRIVDGNTIKKYILTSNNGQYTQITKKGLDRFFRENTVLNALASNNSIQCKGMSATQLPKYTMDKQFGMVQINGLSEQEIICMSQPLIQEWQAKQIRKAQGNQDDSKLQYIINKLDIIRGLIEQSIQMKELTNAFAENGELTRYLKQIDIDNADGDSLESLVKNRGVNGLADGLQNRLKSLHNRAQKYNLQSKEYDGVTISKACSILNKQCEEIRKLHLETKKIIKLNKKQETIEEELELNNDEELVKVEIDTSISEDISFDDIEEIKEEDIVTVDLDKVSEEELDFDKIEDISKEENTEEKEIEDIIKEIRHRITEDINKPFNTSKMYEALKKCLGYVTKENYKRFIDDENYDGIALSMQAFLNKEVSIIGFECAVNINNDTCQVKVCNSSYDIGVAIYIISAYYSKELLTGLPGSKRSNIIDEGIRDKQIELGDKCIHELNSNLSKFMTKIYLEQKNEEQERVKKEKQEQERLEKEKQEQERIQREQEKAEQERIRKEQEQLRKEQAERERQERERQERERLERLERERLERERMAYNQDIDDLEETAQKGFESIVDDNESKFMEDEDNEEYYENPYSYVGYYIIKNLASTFNFNQGIRNRGVSVDYYFGETFFREKAYEIEETIEELTNNIIRNYIFDIDTSTIGNNTIKKLKRQRDKVWELVDNFEQKMESFYDNLVYKDRVGNFSGYYNSLIVTCSDALRSLANNFDDLDLSTTEDTEMTDDADWARDYLAKTKLTPEQIAEELKKWDDI